MFPSISYSFWQICSPNRVSPKRGLVRKPKLGIFPFHKTIPSDSNQLWTLPPLRIGWVAGRQSSSTSSFSRALFLFLLMRFLLLLPCVALPYLSFQNWSSLKDITGFLGLSRFAVLGWACYPSWFLFNNFI